MSNFFEVSPDDIILVAKRIGKEIDENKSSEIMLELDLFFDKELQYTDDISEQTDIVYDLIEAQLKEYFEKNI